MVDFSSVMILYFNSIQLVVMSCGVKNECILGLSCMVL